MMESCHFLQKPQFQFHHMYLFLIKQYIKNPHQYPNTINYTFSVRFVEKEKFVKINWVFVVVVVDVSKGEWGSVISVQLYSHFMQFKVNNYSCL